jgi:hypothetical protein
MLGIAIVIGLLAAGLMHGTGYRHPAGYQRLAKEIAISP